MIRKFSLFLFSVMIPATIIYSSINTWRENIVANLVIQASKIVSSYSIDISYVDGSVVHITRPEPNIPWGLLVTFLLAYYLIKKKLINPYIRESMKKMEVAEIKRSIVIVVEEVMSKLVYWFGVYIVLTNLGANYQTRYVFLNGLNWMMISIIIGEMLRFKETIRHINIYWKSKKRT